MEKSSYYVERMNSIVCPSCGKTVEITEALTHQLEDEIKKDLKVKHEGDLKKLKEEIERQTKKKIEEEIQFKLKDSENQVLENKEKNKRLQEQLLEFTKQMRALKQKDEEREVELQKILLEERTKLKEEITKTEQEKSYLEKQELQKQLDDTKKALDEAQRKADQKSQQLQGEVLELDLESQLKECFPTDEILPVPKGTEGADIWHKVRNKFGQTAGSILWELKRTKAWSNSWTAKLREDIRKIGADTAILVSEILPQEIENFGLYNGVLVCNYRYAVSLASIMRKGILEVAIAKSTAINKDEKLEALYAYLTDNGFRHRFEAQVESIIELRNDLETEQRSMVRIWKKRETQINRMKNNIAALYGELQGIVGPALPSLPSLDTVQLLPPKNQTSIGEE